jgi:membrane protein YdbS with pleckstrin-like domain
MVGWVARFLLISAGAVTGWFIARDEPNFGVIQMATALLLLTFVVAILAFRPARWTVWRHRFGSSAQHPGRARDPRKSEASIAPGREQGGSHGDT